MPKSIDIREVGKHIAQVPGVESFHHLHIWAMSTTENAATIHVVLKDLSRMEEVKHAIKEELHGHGIQHSTIECETPGSRCEDICCCR